ncbi:MAG TPA: hypothetical protein VGL41_06165 [Roseiarcus sp.]
MLMHRDYGLWHSYRGALALQEELAPPVARSGKGPCESCAQRPCLSACPVSAFTAEGYDVARCREHLRGPGGRECLEGGCLARRACPVGQTYAHGPRQTRFHMRAFLTADPLNPSPPRAARPSSPERRE